MRKLYLKIIAAIWIVMLISAVGVTFVADALTPINDERPQQPPWHDALENIAERASSEARGQGTSGLREWFESHTLQRGMPPLTVLDDGGNVIAGPSPPSGPRGPSIAGDRRLQSVAFEHDGRLYRLVLPRPPEHDFVRSFFVLALRPPFLWLLLLTAIALSVVLSIAVARYLVHPLRTVEAAGRRLSQGDLSARVGPALGRRRDEIAEFAATFDQMAERIESLVSAHKDLLRDVSHELRSPLARAHAALSLARQRPSEALDVNLDRVETEIERLNGMIGRLLTFSRLDSGERPKRKEAIELGDLLHGIVEASRLEAEPGGKCVTLHDDEPIVVAGDPELLASCFENVIRNAILHTTANTAVDISLSRNNGPAHYCCVTVRDHGNGVSEPELRRIFEPFYRVHPGATSLNGGSGIGLAIAKRAISWHEGSISAANAPDGGLIVSILLPIHRDNISAALS